MTQVFVDNKNEQHIVIQVNLKKNQVRVYSNFSAWKNIGILIEALGMLIKMAIKEGKSKKEVYEGINEYLTNVLTDYDKVWKEKPFFNIKEIKEDN